MRAAIGFSFRFAYGFGYRFARPYGYRFGSGCGERARPPRGSGDRGAAYSPTSLAVIEVAA